MKKTKKLALAKETVRNLARWEDLAIARGGSALSCWSRCIDVEETEPAPNLNSDYCF